MAKVLRSELIPWEESPPLWGVAYDTDEGFHCQMVGSREEARHAMLPAGTELLPDGSRRLRLVSSHQ